MNKSKVQYSIVTLGLALGLCASTSMAQDTDTERTMGTTITGNQEQPQTLFLIPWKEPGDGAGDEFETDLDALFGLIEREPFVRELRYRNMVVTRRNAQGR